MNQMSLYQFQYIAFLEDAGIHLSALPEAIQTLIQKANAALKTLAEQEIQTQMEYGSILAQTDAFICAQIYQWQPETFKAIPFAFIKDSKLDKIKLLALKAKALQLKG